MVGRVPLCVHGAGETKTGSLSTPGAEEEWELFVQLLGDLAQHPAPLPKAAVLCGSEGLDGREANSSE